MFIRKAEVRSAECRMVKATKDSSEILCAILYIEDAEQQIGFIGTVVDSNVGWVHIHIDDNPQTAD